MPTPQFITERYRREAALIRRNAAAAPDEDTRQHLLLTARLYDQLADCAPRQRRYRRRQPRPEVPAAN
jgi:hypothetical protein